MKRYVLFKLSMPKVNTWNGKWTGSKNLYAIVKNIDTEIADNICGRNYFYDFNDGWIARIDVMYIDSSESTVIKKKSSGFLGYEWMVDSIINNRAIISISDFERGIK